MRALLDTHAFLWWIDQHERLSPEAAYAIADPDAEILVSAVNTWEIVIKAKIGRFDMPAVLPPFLREQIALNGFGVLPVRIEHTLAVYDLPDRPRHKDPFDRLLAAQATAENLPLISGDEHLDGYGIERIW